MSLKTTIADLIGNNKLDAVLEQLTKHLESSTFKEDIKDEYQNEIIHLESKKNDLSNRHTSGLITQEVYNVERAQWNKQVLAIVDRIESGQAPIPVTKKRNKAWMYVLGLLLAAGAGYGYWTMNDQEEDIICPSFGSEVVCKLMVSDFNYNSSAFADINQLIADEINSNRDINRFIEAKYSSNIAETTSDKKISPKAIMETCNYDYRITGSLLKTEEGNDLTIRLQPDVKRKGRKYRSRIGDLTELVDMIEDINLDKIDTTFIISDICLACARKGGRMQTVVEDLVIKSKNSLSKQYLLNELATISLVNKDTMGSIQMLREIQRVAKNDYALGAMEEESELLLAASNHIEAFNVQTQYISKIEDQIRVPSKYKSTISRAALKDGQNNMRMKRGKNVLENYSKLKKNRSPNLGAILNRAIYDFKLLEKHNYNNQGSKFNQNINKLELLRTKNQIISPEALDSSIAVITPVVADLNTIVYGTMQGKGCSAEMLPDVFVQNQKVKINDKGFFMMTLKKPTPTAKFSIKDKQWQIKQRLDDKKNYQLQLAPRSETKKISGTLINSNKKPVSKARLWIEGDESNRVITKRDGRFELSETVSPCSVLVITYPDRTVRKINLSKYFSTGKPMQLGRL